MCNPFLLYIGRFIQRLIRADFESQFVGEMDVAHLRNVKYAVGLNLPIWADTADVHCTGSQSALLLPPVCFSESVRSEHFKNSPGGGVLWGVE